MIGVTVSLTVSEKRQLETSPKHTNAQIPLRSVSSAPPQGRETHDDNGSWQKICTSLAKLQLLTLFLRPRLKGKSENTHNARHSLSHAPRN